MIRTAALPDVGAIVRMSQELALATAMPIDVDPSWTAAFVARIVGGDGLALVVDADGAVDGFLVATVGHSCVSPKPIAVEHGWWCGPAAKGYGGRLLARYEDWARAQGCAFARMSIPHQSLIGEVLSKRRGYQFAETAMVKAL